jgi:hypothetical protein
MVWELMYILDDLSFFGGSSCTTHALAKLDFGASDFSLKWSQYQLFIILGICHIEASPIHWLLFVFFQAMQAMVYQSGYIRQISHLTKWIRDD